jgi:hypothetical protein
MISIEIKDLMLEKTDFFQKSASDNNVNAQNVKDVIGGSLSSSLFCDSYNCGTPFPIKGGGIGIRICEPVCTYPFPAPPIKISEEL